jgi:transcriptional regulator with XRE-family HTH domain
MRFVRCRLRIRELRADRGWSQEELADVSGVHRTYIGHLETNLRILIEYKRYHPTKKVGVELVRALYGVKTHEHASKAILATTSSFTRGAENLFHAHQWELEPRDYRGVLDWINDVKIRL